MIKRLIIPFSDSSASYVESQECVTLNGAQVSVMILPESSVLVNVRVVILVEYHPNSV